MDNKWFEQKYKVRYPDGTSKEVKFYDVSPEDAFYIWHDYNMRVNLKSVNYKFWDFCRWEIKPEKYFEFLRNLNYF